MKLLPAVCAAAFCAGLISVRADDSPVQAAARAALEQEMNQLDNPQAPVSPAPAKSATNVAKAAPAKTMTPAAAAPTAQAPAPAPKPVAPAPQAAPVVVAPVMTSTPAVAAPAEAPPATAPSAPETVAAPATPEPATPPAAETKPAESAMTPEPAAAAPAAPTNSETTPAPAATAASPAMAAPAAPETPAMAPQDAARAALDQKMNELNHAQGLPVSGSMSPASPGAAQQTGMPNPASQVTAVVPGKELGLNSIEAPYVPITAAQEAQLDDLLAKYKANEITPLEYHKQRAAILARHQP